VTVLALWSKDLWLNSTASIKFAGFGKPLGDGTTQEVCQTAKDESALLGGDSATTTTVNPFPFAGSAPDSQFPVRKLTASGWAVARGRKHNYLPMVKRPHTFRSQEAHGA